MATRVQLRRGTTTDHSTFTGAEGEVTVNTTKDTLVVHDGSTAGGFEIASVAATQTLTNKTVLLPTNTSISAAGTTQGTATALTSDSNIVTTVTASSGVVLPTAAAGRRIFIINRGANILSIYPASGAYIDSLAQNAAIQVAPNGSIELIASSTTQWYSVSRLAIYSAAGTLLN